MEELETSAQIVSCGTNERQADTIGLHIITLSKMEKPIDRLTLLVTG